MNANELADCLEEILKGTAIGKDCTAMLREQVKEISSLKKQIVESTIKQAFYEDDYHKATVKIELLKANLRDVANQLRGGVSKIQQKTMARVIEECFGEKK